MVFNDMTNKDKQEKKKKDAEQTKQEKAETAPKPKKTKEERIAELEAKKKQIQKRITKLTATDKTKERKHEARKKIILGCVLLNLMKYDDNLQEKIKGELEKLTAKKDKELFENFLPEFKSMS
jgi:hypothetical protein